jgi:hypothetical protein
MLKEKTKKKIEDIVKVYVDVFNTEYQLFLNGHKKKVSLQGNKFSLAKGDLEMRNIHDMPETLYNLFFAKLDKDEFEELFTNEGAYWFANKFIQFKVAEKI